MKFCGNVKRCMSSSWPILVIFIFGARAERYDILCPDKDNPLNFAFHAPVEKVVGPRYRTTGPLGMDFLDPRDVACKTNFDDITTEEFQRAVHCHLASPKTLFCEVDSKCVAQRKEILSRVREATLNALNEVVLKIKGIKYFDFYFDTKRLLFGTEPLMNLTGLEIVKRATLGQFNIATGFTVQQWDTPSRKDFNDMFNKGVELYATLSQIGEPTGIVADHNQCLKELSSPFLATEDEKIFCINKFFLSWKDRSGIGFPDSGILSLLDEALEYIINYLTLGDKHFAGLKVPFTGDCVGNQGVEPGTPYSILADIVKNMEDLP